MRRYWVAPEAVENDLVTFRDETFHHVVDVCRTDIGDKFEVLVGDGRARFCEMTAVQRGKRGFATARILEQRDIAPLKIPHLHLALSVSRFSTMDTVVEKAVELGVSSFQPLFSEHSFIRQVDKLSASKFQRWQKIVQGATQQSGRGSLMRLEPAQDLKRFLETMNRPPNAMGLFAYEGEGRPLKQGLSDLDITGCEHLWLFVGSEGGFSAAEVELFRSRGLDPFCFGSQVLRVETACVALLSVIKYHHDL